MMATSRGRGVKEMIDPVKPTNMSSLWRGAGVGRGEGRHLREAGERLE